MILCSSLVHVFFAAKGLIVKENTRPWVWKAVYSNVHNNDDNIRIVYNDDNSHNDALIF